MRLDLCPQPAWAGNLNFCSGMIWHLLLAMEPKSKYLRRLSHLYHEFCKFCILQLRCIKIESLYPIVKRRATVGPESINVSITATYKYRFFAAFSYAATPSIRNHNRFNVSTAAIKCMTFYFILNSILDFDIAAI